MISMRLFSPHYIYYDYFYLLFFGFLFPLVFVLLPTTALRKVCVRSLAKIFSKFIEKDQRIRDVAQY